MQRRVAALVALIALIVIASGAEAASQKLWNTCGKSEDLDASIEACTQILAGRESAKNRALAFYDRGWAYDKKGQHDLAMADYNQAIELDTKSGYAFNARSIIHTNNGNYDLAIADATRAIELQPQWPEPYVNRVSASISKGDYDGAFADLARLFELNPKYAGAFAWRADAYNHKGDYDRALADATRAIEIDPKSAMAFGERGGAYNGKGDYDRAIADLIRAIELDPKYLAAYHQRGIAYRNAGKLDLARADFTKALELKPDSKEVMAALAELERAEASKNVTATPSPSPAQQAAVEPEQPAVQTPAPSLQDTSVPLGRRVALVIGNADYKNTPALRNPQNDASDMAVSLKRLGFQVIFKQDLDKHGMDEAFREFAREVRSADAALFYYAGHAMQFEGVNYLMPVDARLADETDVPYEMAKLDDVVADMARMNGVRIAVLDACRNNPLEEQLKRSVASTRGAAMNRGLARVARPEGLIVAYATQSGNVAEDGSGRNSPFTAALLQNIETPGLEVGTLFRRVMGSVKQATGGKQHPELSVLFDGEFYFKPVP
jgi:tetratricopeptide (TPR) repeat protein